MRVSWTGRAGLYSPGSRANRPPWGWCIGEPAPPGSPSASDDPARALAQRERDRAAVNAVIGPIMGLAPPDVPDLAVLLFGPLARGTEVGLASD